MAGRPRRPRRRAQRVAGGVPDADLATSATPSCAPPSSTPPTASPSCRGSAPTAGTRAERHAQVARDLGCQAVMALPPNAYRGDDRAVLEHFELIASVGLPVTAYNNPIDTKIDLTPALLGQLHREGFIVGVKEFSGDVRRSYEIAERRRDSTSSSAATTPCSRSASPAPSAGSPAIRRSSPSRASRSTRRAAARDLETALPLYRTLHPVLRWDSKTRVRPGDQARPGHGRTRRWASAVRRASRSTAGHRAGRACGHPGRSSTPGVEVAAVRSRLVLHAVDSHTEGMPTRVITGGVGVLPGATMAERRTRFVAERDDLRTLLMYEPRGHASMSRGDPPATDPPRRRLRCPVHRGLRLPADVRARHDRCRDGARRDRHGRRRRSPRP